MTTYRYRGDRAPHQTNAYIDAWFDGPEPEWTIPVDQKTRSAVQAAYMAAGIQLNAKPCGCGGDCVKVRAWYRAAVAERFAG